jgi:hypothetical protein
LLNELVQDQVDIVKNIEPCQGRQRLTFDFQTLTLILLYEIRRKVKSGQIKKESLMDC